MPIFEQGYQHWHGELKGHAWSWLTITRHGVRAQFRSRWIKAIVFTALMPAVGLASLMVLWGLVEQKASFIQPFIAMMRDLPGELKEGPRNFRVPIWTLAFYFFFQVEMFFSMLLVLFVGQSLISQDLRFNAMPLYFSRPLRRIDYFLGKLGIIGTYLAAVAIVPVLVAYLLGISFSMDLSVLRDTAWLLAASLTYGLVVVVSAGTLMLALSSLSRNSRYVGAMWFGLWFISNGVAGVLVGSVGARWCSLVSYTTNLARICGSLLDTRSAWRKLLSVFRADVDQPEFELLLNPSPWTWSAGVLLGLLLVSIWVLSRRVRSLDRMQ
jgi:ABC-2 type transport system permease protein